MSTTDRRVKGIRFDPDLLEAIEADAARRGEDINQWIDTASRARLAPRNNGGRLKAPLNPGSRSKTPPPKDARDVTQRKGKPFS